MSAPRIPLPRNSTPPRHLFRHLLREASYLPPVCAAYIAARIKSQFRAHREEKHLAPERLSAGRRQLRRLQAANRGDVKQLERVFTHTFGRAGEQRRELIGPLVRPDPPASSEEAEAKAGNRGLSKLQAVYDKARNVKPGHKRDFIDNWDFSKLHEFLQSQIAHASNTSPAVWPREPPTKVNPAANMPENDIWGRPISQRAVRSTLKKWWLGTIAKVMPPLGEGEWETLRGLATSKGLAPLLRIPPRRALAAPVQGGGEQDGKPWSWEAYASLPAWWIERERKAGFQESVKGLRYEPVPAAPEARASNRKLRRLAGRTFEVSPYIKRDEKTAKSTIVWGSLTPDLPVVPAGAHSFFEGLDASGSVKKADAKGEQQDLKA